MGVTPLRGSRFRPHFSHAGTLDSPILPPCVGARARVLGAVPFSVGAAAGAEGTQTSPVALAVLGVVACACLVPLFVWISLRMVVEHRLLDDLPTSKARAAFIGVVELTGTAESAWPLRSPIAEQACVYYRYLVQEEFRQEDENGREWTDWKLTDSGEWRQPFYLRDETGSVQIRPRKAVLHCGLILDRKVKRDDPMYPQGTAEGDCRCNGGPLVS